MSTYYFDCNQVIPEHHCNPCDSGELGRVRGVAFIRKSFEFLNPSDPAEWQEGIANGDIIVIPETSGEVDGGKPKEGPGYGDRVSTIIGTEYNCRYVDPTYKSNYLFYNAIKNHSGYKFAYRTENLVHITDVPVTVFPKNPVQSDIESHVVWDVEVKWVSKNIAEPFDLPQGIFTCTHSE